MMKPRRVNSLHRAFVVAMIVFGGTRGCTKSVPSASTPPAMPDTAEGG